jgi:hypothetical protein
MPTLQPSPKVSRSLRLSQIDGTQVLTITMQQGTRDPLVRCYDLLEEPGTNGLEFALSKSELAGGETYHVSLDDFGSCTCRGHRGWRPCKHLAALRKLRELGRI